MWLLLATLIAAALVIIATRGSFAELGRSHAVAAWLLVLGLGIQAALEYIHFSRAEIDTVGYGLLMLSYVCILTFCLANIRTRGFGVIAIGVAMNALVIGLNQGMPTKPVGDDAHGDRIYKPVERTVKHRQESDHDLLGALGDRILFPKPFDTLVSFGDLVIAVGICEFGYYGTRRRPHADPVT